MSDKFEGFAIPNTTPVPDIVFDELLKELTGNELKVLLYIIRRTYGFGKNTDAISLSQFRRGITTQDKKVLDKGCGIEHNRTILAALASLEKKGYVVANKRQTNVGDADTTIYRLRLKGAPIALPDKAVVTPGNHVVTSGHDGSYPRSRRSLPGVTTVVTPGNPQETVKQETDIQERESASPNVDALHAPADLSEDDGGEETKKQPALVLGAQFKTVKSPSKQPSPPAHEVVHEHSTDGPATADGGSEPGASGGNKPEKPKRQRKEKPPLPELPLEVTQFLDAWDSLHRAPLPRTDRLIAQAKAGVAAKITPEELKGCRDWLPTTDRPGKPYYRHKGVGLWDILDKIGEYRSVQNMPIPNVPVVDMPQTKPMDVYTAHSMDKERTQRLLEQRKAERLAREAQEAAMPPKPPSYADEAPAQTRMRLAREAAAKQQGGTQQ